jgi:hypothetical protein
MGILKDIKAAVTPSVDAVEQATETAKSIEQITEESAHRFPPSEGTAPVDASAPRKQRKPRDPSTYARGPRGMGKSASQTAAQASVEAGQAAAYTVDKQIVEKTASTVLGTIDGILMRKVVTTVAKLGGDKSLAEEMANDSGLPIAERQLMSELTGVIFEKHGLLSGYAPELLLLVCISEWGVRVTVTLRKLNAMVEEQEKKRKNENKE